MTIFEKKLIDDSMDKLTRKMNGVGGIADCAIFAAQVVNYYISKGKISSNERYKCNEYCVLLINEISFNNKVAVPHLIALQDFMKTVNDYDYSLINTLVV